MNHNESLCHYDEYNIRQTAMLLYNALDKLFEFSFNLALSFNFLCYFYCLFRGLSDLSKHCKSPHTTENTTCFGSSSMRQLVSMMQAHHR